MGERIRDHATKLCTRKWGVRDRKETSHRVRGKHSKAVHLILKTTGHHQPTEKGTRISYRQSTYADR
jgi:hypothetical protein